MNLVDVEFKMIEEELKMLNSMKAFLALYPLLSRYIKISVSEYIEDNRSMITNAFPIIHYYVEREPIKMVKIEVGLPEQPEYSYDYARMNYEASYKAEMEKYHDDIQLVKEFYKVFESFVKRFKGEGK